MSYKNHNEFNLEGSGREGANEILGESRNEQSKVRPYQQFRVQCLWWKKAGQNSHPLRNQKLKFKGNGHFSSRRRRHLVRYISNGFRKRVVTERHFLLHTVYFFAIVHTLQVVILRAHKGLFVSVGNIYVVYLLG